MILIWTYKKYKRLIAEIDKLKKDYQKMSDLFILYRKRYRFVLLQLVSVKRPEYCQKSYCDDCSMANTRAKATDDPEYENFICLLGYKKRFSK